MTFKVQFSKSMKGLAIDGKMRRGSLHEGFSKDRIFTVYGVQNRKDDFGNEITMFLFYEKDCWYWDDFDDYEPYIED